jgi:hypothetical protein
MVNYLSFRLIATFNNSTQHYYVSAVLFSKKLNVNNKIDFAIDTGSPNIVISYRDAQRCKIDFEKLKTIPTPKKTLYGDFNQYHLYDYQLTFKTGKTQFIMDARKGCQFYGYPLIVLQPNDQTIGKEMLRKIPSLLGLSFLQEFNSTIRVSKTSHDMIINLII